MSENSVLFCGIRGNMMQSALCFGLICLLKIKDFLRISAFVCVGLSKHSPVR